MSDTFQTGKTFTTGEQVTATDLNNAVNQAVPKVPLTDDQSITVVNNKLTVKDGSSTSGVPLNKIQHIIGHSVIGNIGSATAAPTNIEVDANEAVLGNSAGNGLITDKIDTDNIKDDAITIAKTSFIADNTATMTLTGTAPRLILDDDGNSGDSPEVNGNSVDGSLSILATRSGADITIDADDNLMLKHNGTEGFRVAADAGKDENGNDTAGAKVTGGLYVTGDVYADDQVVADHLLLTGNQPNITFTDTDVSTTSPYITGNSSIGSLEMKTVHTGSDIFIDANDVVLLRHQGNNIFAISDDVGKDASGADVSGAQVTGSLEVTGDVYVNGAIRATTNKSHLILESATPYIKFNDTDYSVDAPYITGNSEFGNLNLFANEDGAEIKLSTNSTLRLEVGQDVAKNAAGTDNQAGCKVTDDIYATGDISADGDVVASLSSDKRLKDNIAPIQDATSKVKKLSGNTFDWNDKSKYSGSDVGVIAQEVQEIIPSAVKETEEGYLKVEYTKIVPLLIESIKELSAKVQELEAKVK